MDMGTCRSCAASIRWLLTPSGARMPLDPDPCEDGNIVVRNGLAVTLGKGNTAAGEARYKSHYASCPFAAKHRKRK